MNHLYTNRPDFGPNFAQNYTFFSQNFLNFELILHKIRGHWYTRRLILLPVFAARPRYRVFCTEYPLVYLNSLEKVYFRSQILERPSIGEYWNISGVPVLSENVTFTFFRTCWCYSEAYNTGMQKWSSIVQYSCTSIWDFKYTFPTHFLFLNLKGSQLDVFCP